MRVSEKADRSRLIAAAMQKIPCDLTVENVKLVNVITGEIYPASVDVLDGTIVRVREEGETTEVPSRTVYDGKGAYLMPGFIDAHMHVESTMMIPENFARVAVPWGTTTVCTDPHEIGNVMGIPGVKFMLESGRQAALRHLVLAPSCVPAVPGLESTGADFFAKEVGELLDMDDVVGIAEIMDYVGVYNDTDRMHTIIDEGIKRNLLLQGHAPSVTGKELAAYRIGGPVTDHESNTAEEINEKLRMGIHVNLRASSIVDNLGTLLGGLKNHKFYDFVSVCTDDVHAKDILEKGHLNSVIGKAIKKGIEPLDIIKMATLNAAREYGFDDLGAIAPGYLADMQLVDELDGRRPNAVFIKGQLVAENGNYIAKDPAEKKYDFPNTVNMEQLQTADDFRLKAPEGCGDKVKTLIMEPVTKGIVMKGSMEELPVVNGYVTLGDHDDLQFVCIANRYGTGTKSIVVMRNYGLKEGAVASTVSHDSHNFTVIYKDAEDALAAAQELKRTGGGMCAVKEGKILYTLPLPVAGLMSTLPCEPLAKEIETMEKAMLSLCPDESSILMIACLALPVRPGLIMTDIGIVDGLTQEFVSQF
ncbi:adenine deaminase [Anaerolentibacter hominis]|uniref:adenine deaminase n=1 Tax=Anaerolentibacter hominis TaxID=3079009 RepID=UPI0031B8A929